MNKTTAQYPEAPGFKGEAETGAQAASCVASKAEQLRKMIQNLLKSQQLTHDECAAALRPPMMNDVDYQNFKRSVRSRGSELKAQGIITDSGKRRTNDSGCSAVVWKIVEHPAIVINPAVANTATASTKQTQTELF